MKFNVDDLIEQGLVKKKTYTKGMYKGLSVLKYTKKVFFKNLWHLDERLLECRGTVVDEEDNVIVLPFKKVFNLHENDTEVVPNLKIIAPMKINGFMCAVTKTEKYGLIVSTTGTLDSEYAELARKHINKLNTNSLYKNTTFLFEICDKSDPHIVEEEEGAYLIGIRSHKNWNELRSEEFCDAMSILINAKRPEVIKCKFKDLPETETEGYMIRDYITNKVLCKLKSNFYLSKKALMRVGKAKVDVLYDNTEVFKQRLDEEFYDFVDYLVQYIDKETWRSYNDQQRREVIEEYFK